MQQVQRVRGRGLRRVAQRQWVQRGGVGGQQEGEEVAVIPALAQGQAWARARLR